MKINRYAIAISIIVLAVFIAINCSSKGHKPTMKTTHVHCGKGQSLSAIVKQSQEYTRIVVKGKTCQDDEPVIVTQDNIVIDGNGAVLDGRDSSDPVIIVRAKNVVIKNLTVTRGMHGIVIEKGATAVLKDVNANENKGSGIVVGEAIRLPNPDQNPNQIPVTKPLTLNQSTDNSLSGLFKEVLENSSFDMSIVKEARADSEFCQFICPRIEGMNLIEVELSTFCGVVNSNDNGVYGVSVNTRNVEICGELHAGNTSVDAPIQKYGIIVDGSVMNITGSSTTRNNVLDGVFIRGGSSLNLVDEGTMTSAKNSEHGLHIGEGTSDESAVNCSSNNRLNLNDNNRMGPIGGNTNKVLDCLWP